MAELKTKPNDASVTKFLNGVKDERKRKDAFAVLKMMKQITRIQPKMWGPSIVGFGTYRYKYASGREGDWFLIGFSPRKQNLTLYVMSGLSRSQKLLAKLGKHKASGSCLYLNSLEDIDPAVLKQLIKESVAYLKKRYR